VKQNPAAGDVLADTGALAQDTSGSFNIIVSSSVMIAIAFERRNVANDQTIQSHLFPVGANGLVPGIEFNVQALQGERLRLIVDTPGNGRVQGTISTGAI